MSCPGITLISLTLKRVRFSKATGNLVQERVSPQCRGRIGNRKIHVLLFTNYHHLQTRPVLFHFHQVRGLLCCFISVILCDLLFNYFPSV